ncbi:MAG: membrane protein of unknown function [Candidatus Thorarchaeota archaeon]|nr:MAG: membrane protein of unknown function [Candidatus Thorarchaeota archaeon]
MKKPFDVMMRWSTGRNLLLMIILSAVSVLIMGYFTQTLVYDVFGEVTMPDTRISYTYQEILTAFNELGGEGLQVWSQVHLLDTIFPIGYSFAMIFALGLEIKKTLPEKQSLRIILLLPILGAIMDYMENALIASQVGVYPNISESVIAVASIFTSLKWIFIYTSFAIIFILAIVWIIQKIKKPRVTAV